MEKLLDRITAAVSEAFVNCGYEAEYGKVTISNRPDLCEYQCNGAMAGAKKYHCAPIQIANKVAESLKEQELFSEVNAVNPGFLTSVWAVRRPRTRKPSSLITADPTWRSRCMWDISVLPSSARA